jgi:hypothetical protein
VADAPPLPVVEAPPEPVAPPLPVDDPELPPSVAQPPRPSPTVIHAPVNKHKPRLVT